MLPYIQDTTCTLWSQEGKQLAHTQPTLPSQSPAPTLQLPARQPPLSFCSAFPLPRMSFLPPRLLASRHPRRPHSHLYVIHAQATCHIHAIPAGRSSQVPPCHHHCQNQPPHRCLLFLFQKLIAPEKINSYMPFTWIHPLLTFCHLCLLSLSLCLSPAPI